MIQEKKRSFVPPAILHEVRLDLNAPLLVASKIEKRTKVETAGQDNHSYDFSDDNSFTTNWE